MTVSNLPFFVSPFLSLLCHSRIGKSINSSMDVTRIREHIQNPILMRKHIYDNRCRRKNIYPFNTDNIVMPNSKLSLSSSDTSSICGSTSLSSFLSISLSPGILFILIKDLIDYNLPENDCSDFSSHLKRRSSQFAVSANIKRAFSRFSLFILFKAPSNIHFSLHLCVLCIHCLSKT